MSNVFTRRREKLLALKSLRSGGPRSAPAPACPAPRRTFHVVYSTSGNMQSRNSVATLCDVTCEAPWHS